MDKSEKVHYEESVSEYIEKKQLPEYFELLTKQLVLNQPDDPTQFLIEFLQTRRYARIIFVTGIVQDQRRHISSQIANYMNFKEIPIEDFYSYEDIQQIDDDQINERAYQCIINNEKHYRGYVISGYPNNFRQATFIQQKGIIAERVYILKFSNDDCKKHYEQFYKDEKIVECALIRDQLNAKELRESYNKYYDEFDTLLKRKEDIIDIMKSQLKLKDQRTQPLKSPIVVIVSPPFLRQKSREIFELLAEKYGLHSISFDQLVQKQIDSKTEVGKYLQRNLKIKHKVPNDIASTLVRTEVTQPVSRHKGWILEGFPTNAEQISIFKNYRINPHLVIIMDDDEEALIQKYQQILIDPIFQQRYEPQSKLDEQTEKRLIKDDSSKEFYQEILSEYRTFIKDVEMQFENHTQRFRMTKETSDKIMKQVDVFINNPKIYS